MDGSLKEFHSDGTPLDIYEFLESRQYATIAEISGKLEDEKSILTFARDYVLWLSRDRSIRKKAKERNYDRKL